ncbi:acetyl-CoA C-acyltransferase family protein [Motiliproteus sp. MSK22-1]|uniref:acetyl-CoA C-acyltransferase family protein n=1 Tax=Motiliproteus sp. MSK22-1 TaxID=1897630 RepID=UPI000975C67E|nr:acetyl-CoA C-acyltransferase family protein [Motiliproteus sp. MSK22-1]OMH39728.1 acetyl-CoA acetyltransferase [Motiliproteus sp. MSK22-1]
MSNKEVVVVSGVRTAIGDFGGSLKTMSPCNLASAVVKEAVKRSGLAPEEIGHSVFGNVVHTEARDMYLSRVAAVEGGLPHETPSLTVNRLCGSGLQAIVSATQQIELGMCEAAVAGGSESMSRTQYWIPGARFGQRMGDGQIIDAMVGALTCPFDNTHMGITAENIAEKWNISREEQDALATESHNRAEKAIAEGRFKEQILPIEIKSRKGVTVFDTDEHVRNGMTVDQLSGMRPAFKKEGTVTAGNASGLNDAAAAVVLMSKEAAEAKGIKPLARLNSYSYAGVEPKYMGIGPVPAVRSLLDKAGLDISDIDVWEVNEAFAAQALAVCRDLELPADRVNVNGSGISLGHPIGATGALITVKALYELQRTQGRYAVVTMCIGGGQGIAALFERI